MTTAVETASTRTCRCGETITNEGTPPHPVHRSQWSWMATDGERPGKFWCEDGKLHTPACPPSSVVDQIVRWSEVREGDLVLIEDSLTVAEGVNVYEDTYQDHTWLRVDVDHRLDNGYLVSSEQHGDRHTAVRRYVEG